MERYFVKVTNDTEEELQNRYKSKTTKRQMYRWKIYKTNEGKVNKQTYT